MPFFHLLHATADRLMTHVVLHHLPVMVRPHPVKMFLLG